MYICVFEDELYRKLLPLVRFRPVCDLKCGMTSLLQKVARSYPNAKLILHVRNYLRDVVKEKWPNTSVNEIPTGAKEILFVNGRILMSDNDKKFIGDKYPGRDIVFTKDNIVVAAWISERNLDDLRSTFNDYLFSIEKIRSVEKKELKGANLATFPWELIHWNGTQLVSDFTVITHNRPAILGTVYDGVHLLNRSQIHIAEGAKVKPGAVLDAEEGPIYISKNVRVMPNAVIEGPAFVGENSVIKISAKIYENTTIGEMCKVGGEIEESIIQGYSNKQHEGFIGHSYLGEWVNIGADSNNSDLKNDYGNVKVYNDGTLIDSGSQFVGLIMGDHSKCGINSMFNTGTVVDVFCNLYGTGTPPKYVPPFTWGEAGNLVPYRIEKAIEVARKVIKRRDIEANEITTELFRRVFSMTNEDRAAAGITQISD